MSILNEIEKIIEGECPKSGCVKEVDGKWRVVSNKTGKLWLAKYNSKEDAEKALKVYHVKKG
jgi:hypothetical protein